MNEREMADTLGLLSEPTENRVKLDPLLKAELSYLKDIFHTMNFQKKIIGTLNPDVWCEFVPWTSLN